MRVQGLGLRVPSKGNIGVSVSVRVVGCTGVGACSQFRVLEALEGASG